MSARLLLLLLLAAPVLGADLAEALAIARRGQPLKGKVDSKVARQSVDGIGTSTPAEELQLRAAVARAGGAERALSVALVQLLTPSAPNWEKALELLAALPPTSRKGLKEQRAVLEAALTDEAVQPPLRKGVAALLVETADAATLAGNIDRWGQDVATRPAAVALLEAAPATLEPDKLVGALLGCAADPALHPPLQRAVHGLALKSPAALEVVLGRAAVGDHGTGAAALRGLGAAPLSRYQQAAGPLVELLGVAADNPTGVEPATLAVVIESSAELLVPELAAMVGQLTARGLPQVVRVAAIEAVVRVGYRDRPTLELLIRLLGDADPKVSTAAWEAAKRKSGATMPAQPDTWREWLDRSDVPAEPPIADTQERLAKERKIRLSSRDGKKSRPRS